MSKKTFFGKAKYIGRDGDFGLETGRTYQIWIRSNFWNDGVCYEKLDWKNDKGLLDSCLYSSEDAVLNNWKMIDIYRYGKEDPVESLYSKAKKEVKYIDERNQAEVLKALDDIEYYLNGLTKCIKTINELAEMDMQKNFNILRRAVENEKI